VFVTTAINLLLLLLLLVGSTAYVHGQVPLSGFYPFGIAAGDRTLPRLDDAFITVNISFDFPFFHTNYREVHLSTNGVIFFEEGSSNFVPRPFPVRDFICIAPYWTDADPSRGGDIFYRESVDVNLLNQITTEIRTRFPQHSSFTSRWALIMTYIDVPAYGCLATATPTGCTTRCAQTLTFQTVMTSNGIYSFTVFNFNKLQYTVGASDCNAHAQIGFNAGDGLRAFSVASSLTPQINNTALDKSNVGTIGKWIFSIDGADIVESCNSRGLLEIFPRKVLFFGSEDLFIGGPCFGNGESVISVQIGDETIHCDIMPQGMAHCLVPYIDALGSTAVSLTHNSTLYQTFVIVIDTNDNKIGNHFQTLDEVQNPTTPFTISWNPNSVAGIGNQILFKGFQIDSNLNERGDVVDQTIVRVNYGQVPNTGSATLPPVQGLNPGQRFVRRVALAGYRDGTETIPVTRIIVRTSRPVCDEYCLRWHSEQPSQAEMNRIVDEVARRSPCSPSRSFTVFPQGFNNFELDPECTPASPDQCQYYHPDARACYRSINNNNGYAAQCCYDTKFDLITGPPSGGSMAFGDPRRSEDNHFWQDVVPYLFCCRCGSPLSCNRYYEKRPSIPATFWPPPNNGGGGGDPHFTTLDGTTYTFNPVGEFTYLTTGTDQIQVRIEQFKDRQGSQMQACYMSAFVVKGVNSDIAQVDLTAAHTLHFRINGQSMNLETGFWNFKNLSVLYQDNQTASIYTSSGTGITVQTVSGALNAIVAIQKTDKDKVMGLLGNWDDDSTNDFQLPNGSWIPIDSTMRDIHYNFGMAWETTAVSSLFAYPTGLSWYDFRDLWFTPDFTLPPPHPACGDDLQCAYDIYLTGDTNLGLSNIVLKNTIEELEEHYEEITSYCPTAISIVHGVVHVESNEAGTQANYTFDCEHDYNLYGDRQLTCVNGDHPPFPVCVDPEDTSMDEVTTEEPTTTRLTSTTELPPFETGCGDALHTFTTDLLPDGWHSLCYILSNNSHVYDTPCRQLLVGLPVYGDAAGLLAAGGNFGCYMGVQHPDDELFTACTDYYQHNAQLSSCFRCPVMYACIRYPEW